MDLDVDNIFLAKVQLSVKMLILKAGSIRLRVETQRLPEAVFLSAHLDMAH